MLDFVGATAQLFAFDAYGNALGFDPSQAATEFLYSGEQFDAKIGQQYLRARYYDPATGRFNRLDPFFGNLDDPQSLHNYLYAHADPINGIDPTGLSMMSSCISAISIGMKTVGMFAAANPLVTAGALGGGIGVFANGVSNYSTGRGFLENAGWAAGAGMLLGPIAVAFPFMGLGLAVWGMVASTSQMYQVWGNVDSSMGQKAASLALVGLACFGTYSAGKNIQVNGFWYNSRILTPSGSFGEEGSGFVRISSILETNGQPQPAIRNIPRVAQDINVNSTAPPPLPLNRNIGGNAKQNQAVSDYVSTLLKLGAADIRINQQQVNIQGQRVGINRPDLQYTLNGKRVYVEWDTAPAPRAIPHGERIMANDPDGMLYLFTMD